MKTTNSPDNRLLLLSCSRAKAALRGDVSALQRYDGPLFRVVRAYLAGPRCSTLPAFVLSAEHGLLSVDARIGLYDRRLTDARAQELKEAVAEGLHKILQAAAPQEVFVAAGERYRSLIPETLLPQGTIYSSGPIGQQAHQLKRWLWRDAYPGVNGLPQEPRGQSMLKGVPVSLPNEGLAAFVQRGLKEEPDAVGRFTAFYLAVDGHHVAAKWLVSRLTGHPVASFRTADAVRVLRQLGVEVRED